MNLIRFFRVMATIAVMLAASAMCSRLNAQIPRFYVVTDIQVMGQKGKPFDQIISAYPGYHAVHDNVAHGVLDCNRGRGSDSYYVSIFKKCEWVYLPDIPGKAILDIVVLEGEKPATPVGYTRIDYDLNKGCGKDSKFLWLAYKRATASDRYFVRDILGYSFNKENEWPKFLSDDPDTEGYFLVKKYGTSTPADLAEKCGSGSKFIRLEV